MSNSKKTFYRINNQEIIFTSSTSRRFFARLIDFLLAGIIGKILLSSYTLINTPSIPANPTIGFENYILDYYDSTMMIGWTIMIIGFIAVLWIFPLLNRKHPGQTIGKKILKITPMYLTKSSFVKSFFIRESFMSLAQIFSLIFIMTAGTSPNYVFAQYKHYLQAFENGPSDQYPIVNTTYSFMATAWIDPFVMGSMVPSTATLTLSYFGQIFATIWFVLMLLCFITILFLPNKRGLHDLASKTTIVYLMSTTNEEEYVKSINVQKPLYNEYELQNSQDDLPPATLKQ